MIRWLPLLLVLVACGQAAPAPELAKPLVVERDVSVPACAPEFGRVERIELGGAYESVAADERWIYATTGSAVRLFGRADGATPTLSTPGEATALLAVGGAVWIAEGSGGLVRLTGLEEPAPAGPGSWIVGGDLVALAHSGGAIWAADRTGRVLRLPIDATQLDAPEEVEVDGSPGSLAPWGDGVLVAAGGAGLLQVSSGPAGLVVEPAPWSPPWPKRVATRDGVIYVASGQELLRWRDGEVSSVELPQRVLGLLPDDDGVLIAAQAAGLFRWDGRSEEAVGWDDAAIAGMRGFSAEGLFRLDEETVLVAGGLLGVVEARWDDGWVAGRVLGEGGLITAVEPVGEGLVVGVATWNDAGRLVGLEVEDGQARVAWTADAGGWPARVLQDGERLLVARRGSRGLAELGAEREGPARLVALEDSSVSSVAWIGDGELVTVSMDRMLHRLRRGEEGWTVAGSAELRRLPMPADVVVRDGVAWTATGAVGMAWRWDGPGQEPEAVSALAAPAGHPEAVFRLARVRGIDGRLQVALPSLGLERIPFDGGASELLRFTPGAWDVVEWGPERVVARGEARA